MKQKLLSAVLMAAAALVLLGCFGKRAGATDYAYYFRDNTEYAGESTLICYAKLPYAEGRNFDWEYLLSAGVIPEMPEYSECYGWADYYEDGSFFDIGVLWQHYDLEHGVYRQLCLTMIPGEIGDPAMRDGFFQPDPLQVTETEVDGVTVYGSGTVELNEVAGQCNTLVFTKDGVRYQIECIRDTTLEELGRVMDFYLAGGVDLDAFAMEKGDTYTTARLVENPDAFPGCIPDTTGLHTANDTTYLLKNGEPYSYEMAIYDADGTQFYWCVGLAATAGESAGTVEDITEEDFRAALTQNSKRPWQVTLLRDQWAIELSCYADEPPVDLMWSLVESLK